MKIEPLDVPDAWLVTPRQHRDQRGAFMEYYKAEELVAATGRRLDLEQGNRSVSTRNVLRGLHFADVPPGQAKYVTCVSGSVLDVVVDLRVGSPTFGRSQLVPLDDVDCAAVLVAEGLGHGFLVLSEQATVTYLCSTGYAPQRERGVNPLDTDIGIAWPAGVTPLLSDKDADAPSLKEAQAQGLLPDYATCRSWYRKVAEER